MNPAISCIEDTLRLLLEEAKQAKETAAAKRGSPVEAFEVGRSEALAEALHTWANQLQTFRSRRTTKRHLERVARVLGLSRLLRIRGSCRTSRCGRAPLVNQYLLWGARGWRVHLLDLGRKEA